MQRGYFVGDIVGVINPRRGHPIPVGRGFHIERTTYFPPHKRNGERERNRRLRQMDEGRLTQANGVAHVD